MPSEPKSLIVIIGKTGAQVTTPCIHEPVKMEQEWIEASNASGDDVNFRIDTGDEHGNIIYINPDDVFLCSIRRFVDEKKAAEEAKKSGIITMDRRIQ